MPTQNWLLSYNTTAVGAEIEHNYTLQDFTKMMLVLII